MKALVKTAPGPGNMELQDRPVPEIEDDDLLIEVRAAGICGSDLRTRKYGNSRNLRTPVILGHEFAGVICKVGKNVKDFYVGQRVVSDNTGYLCGKCDNCARGNYMMCEHRVGLGVGMDGGFTNYVRIPGQLLSVNPHSLFTIPKTVSFEEASLLDPLCNAYKAVVEESHLMPGQDVVVFGLGTLGQMAVAVANLMGAANIIAVNRSDNLLRFDTAKTLGATHCVCSTKQNVLGEIARITSGEMVPVIIDCAGSNEILGLALDILQKGGEFIKVGYDSSPVPFSLDAYINKGIRIQGHFAYDYVGWKNCLRLLSIGKLNVKPVITEHLPLDDWEKGFDDQAAGRAIKVIFEF